MTPDQIAEAQRMEAEVSPVILASLRHPFPLPIRRGPLSTGPSRPEQRA